MTSAEHETCTHYLRLPDGLLWPVPVCLGVPEGVSVGGERLGEAQRVFGTSDPAHPGVGRLLAGSPQQP